MVLSAGLGISDFGNAISVHDHEMNFVLTNDVVWIRLLRTVSVAMRRKLLNRL